MSSPSQETWIVASGCSPEAWLRYAACRSGVNVRSAPLWELPDTSSLAMVTCLGSPVPPDVLSHSDHLHVVGEPPGDCATCAPARLLTHCFPTDETDHTADEGFLVTARTRGDVLVAAAEALAALMVEPASVELREQRAVEVVAEARGDMAPGSMPPDKVPAGNMPDDERLFRFLCEVLYLMDAHRFAIGRIVVLSDGDDGTRAIAIGEPLDVERHLVRGAIKAVTYHGMQIDRDGEGTWRAQVIVDV